MSKVQSDEWMRRSWRVGQRVARKDGPQLGTVVEINGKMKVRWDNGETSYFVHGEKANVQIEPARL